MTQTTHTQQTGKPNQRKLRNLLLQPWIQLRVAAWSAFVGAIFSFAIAMVFYLSLRNLSDQVANIGNLDEATILATYNIFEATRLSALGLLLGQVFISVAVSVVMTHRLVGPTVAFRRHIRNLIAGKSGQRVKLRQGDAFTEVADDLNELAEVLDNRKPKVGSSVDAESPSAVNQ